MATRLVLGARVRAIGIHNVEAEEKLNMKFYQDVTMFAIDRGVKAVRDYRGTIVTPGEF